MESTNTSTSTSKKTSRKITSKSSSKPNEQHGHADLLPKSAYSVSTLASRERILDAMVRDGHVTDKVAGVMRHILAPRSHKNYMSLPEALKHYEVTDAPATVMQQINAGCRKFMEHLMFGTDYMTDAEIRAAKAAEEAARVKRPRRASTDVADEKAEKNARSKARQDLGFPARGRLTPAQKTQLEAAITAILNPVTA